MGTTVNSTPLKLLTTLLVACVLCLNPAVQANGDSSTLEHVVIVWLKEPGNLAHREKIITESQILKSIPGVMSLHIGAVVPSERAIVDSSFDVALIVSFTDRAAQQTYITHPTHIKLLEETLKPLVEKIVVYDFQ